MAIEPRQIWLVLREHEGFAAAHGFPSQFERLREQGYDWFINGLSEWATEDIFARLRERGVDTDADRFRGQAESAGRCDRLEEAWRRDLNLPE